MNIKTKYNAGDEVAIITGDHKVRFCKILDIYTHTGMSDITTITYRFSIKHRQNPVRENEVFKNISDLVKYYQN